MVEHRCNVLIIGGGPGGYVAGIRAGQMGLGVILVEADRTGGTCLNVGCIPSKALIYAAEEFYSISAGSTHSAIGLTVAQPQIDFAKTSAWKDGVVARLTGGVRSLLKNAKVRVITGYATLIDGKSARVTTSEGEQHIICEHLVIATGSEPAPLPALPFGGDVLSSTGALALTELPGSLAVIGAGYIGLELGMAFAKLGVSVTIVETLDRILAQYDSELTHPVTRRLAELRVAVHLEARAIGFEGGVLRISDPQGNITSLKTDKNSCVGWQTASHARVRSRRSRSRDERTIHSYR